MWERKGEENCNKLLFSASSQLISLWEEKKDSFTFTHETVLKISVWRSCGVLYYKLESRACGRIQSNQQSLRPCLDVVGFTSIHVFWCGLEWFFLKKILLQSTLTHVDWYESNYVKKNLIFPIRDRTPIEAPSSLRSSRLPSVPASAALFAGLRDDHEPPLADTSEVRRSLVSYIDDMMMDYTMHTIN